MATEMPSSAPRVVPSARMVSPSTMGRMASLVKSNSTPGAFSQTMSVWAWRMMVSAPSYPGLAGLVSTTLLAASRYHSRPLSFANCTR